MSLIFKIIAVIALTIVAIFLIKKLAERIINLNVLYNKRDKYDLSKQKDGIVFNKKKGKEKLEADQTIILPF